MNKKQLKQFLSIIPGHGTGVNVVDGDINFAIRQFKKEVKDSKKLKFVFDRIEYTKPSVIKRQQKNAAKYKEQQRYLNGN